VDRACAPPFSRTGGVHNFSTPCGRRGSRPAIPPSKPWRSHRTLVTF